MRSIVCNPQLVAECNPPQVVCNQSEERNIQSSRFDDIQFAKRTDYIRLTAITYQSFGLDKKKTSLQGCTLKDSFFAGYGIARLGYAFFLYSSGFQRLFSHFFHCSNQFFFGRNIDNSNRSKVNIYGNVLVTVFIFRTVMNFYPLNQCVYKSGC